MILDIIIIVVIAIIMIAGCYFVNDTKKKHGVCCGKGCAGCPIFEEEINRRKKG